MKHILRHIFIALLGMYSLTSYAEVKESTNNWYVGNTQPGDWIQYKKVWLSAGHYRFTGRIVGNGEGQTVHLEINGSTLKNGVEAPYNYTNTFDLAHLGHKQLEEGYYDLKLVFETGNVNCDMVFIRKDDNTSDNVLDTDIDFENNWNDGMHTFAIGGHAGATRELAKGGDSGDDATWTSAAPEKAQYSRNQVISWNKQSIYNFNLGYTQEAADIYISEMVESKVEVIFAHGRGEPDGQTSEEYDIEDRGYVTGPGGMPCAGLKYMVEAIKRNPNARDNIKIAYFIDNAPFPLAVEKYLGEKFDVANPEHQKFVYEYAIKKWYETVPREMLFFTTPDELSDRDSFQEGAGVKCVPMQWWSADANMEQYQYSSKQWSEFFLYIKQRMKEDFDLVPAFILADNFLNKGDAKMKYIAWGLQGWFGWADMENRCQIVTHRDARKFAFAFNGGRQPMMNLVHTNWNPETNEGTWVKNGMLYNSWKPEFDTHVSSLLDDGETPRIRHIFEEGHEVGAKWIVLEAWSDWREGSVWHRSDHPEHRFPNQYMNLVREFADRESKSIILEAEGCDEYHSAQPGNAGGSYRLAWYKESEKDKDYFDANLEVDLSIFRPLHHLSELSKQYIEGLDKPANSIAAGLRDVWMVCGSDIYCNEIDGHPIKNWKPARQYMATKKISFGSNTVWALSASGKPYCAALPGNQPCEVSNGWSDKSDPNIKIVDIAATMSMVWGIDDQNNVYYRNHSGSKPWTKVPGELTSITADVNSVWGFNPQGEIVRMSAQRKSGWEVIKNPYKIIKLSAGNEEVWGITEDNKVYRMSDAGFGEWQYVNEGFKEVSVGVDYAWLLDVDGYPWKYEMSGFQDITAFQINPIYTSVTPVEVKASVNVAPNPFKDRIKVTVNAYNEEDITLIVHDLNGKVLLTKKESVHSGTNEITINEASQWTQGVYILTVEYSAGPEKIKIIKSR